MLRFLPRSPGNILKRSCKWASVASVSFFVPHRAKNIDFLRYHLKGQRVPVIAPGERRTSAPKLKNKWYFVFLLRLCTPLSPFPCSDGVFLGLYSLFCCSRAEGKSLIYLLHAKVSISIAYRCIARDQFLSILARLPVSRINNTHATVTINLPSAVVGKKTSIKKQIKSDSEWPRCMNRITSTLLPFRRKTWPEWNLRME